MNKIYVVGLFYEDNSSMNICSFADYAKADRFACELSDIIHSHGGRYDDDDDCLVSDVFLNELCFEK